MTWREKGNIAYKQLVEPIDIIKSWSTCAIQSFCLGNIIKYAHRSYFKSGRELALDLDKIIHYAEILKEELCQTNPSSIESPPKEQPISGSKRR